MPGRFRLEAFPRLNRLGDRVRGKVGIIKVDFNVTLERDKRIANPDKIKVAFPTIRDLFAMGVRGLVLVTHLGQPENGYHSELSTRPVHEFLESPEGLNEPVIFGGSLIRSREGKYLRTDQYINKQIQAAAASLGRVGNPRLMLLENVRFTAGEESYTLSTTYLTLSRRIARLGGFRVFEAQAAWHRDHASVTGFLKVYGLQNTAFGHHSYGELEALSRLLAAEEGSIVALVAGSKITGKKSKLIWVEELLKLKSVAKVLVAGKLMNAILVAQGYSAGKAEVGKEEIAPAAKLLEHPQAEKMIFPVDYILENQRTAPFDAIPADSVQFDIGPETTQRFAEGLASAQIAFYSGTPGADDLGFGAGTEGTLNALTQAGFSLLMGGDSRIAAEKYGLLEKVSKEVVGGGATLAFIAKQGRVPVTKLYLENPDS